MEHYTALPRILLTPAADVQLKFSRIKDPNNQPLGPGNDVGGGSQGADTKVRTSKGWWL